MGYMKFVIEIRKLKSVVFVLWFPISKQFSNFY